jgi:hypothetical protein
VVEAPSRWGIHAVSRSTVPVAYESIEPQRYRPSAPPLRASIVVRVTRDNDPGLQAFWLEAPGITREWARANEGETGRDAQKRKFRKRVLDALADVITERLFTDGEVTLALEAGR